MLGFHKSDHLFDYLLQTPILTNTNIVLALILIVVHVQPTGIYTSVIYYVS